MKNKVEKKSLNESKSTKKELKAYKKPEFHSYGSLRVMTMGALSQPIIDSGGSMFFSN